VNSTLACALVGAKLLIPVAHLEAGLRSGDRTMPEEINRIVTDAISDLLWTPSPDGDQNLRREGVAEDKIAQVGNIMLDSFELLAPKIRAAGGAGKLGLPNNVSSRVSGARSLDSQQLLLDAFRRHVRERALDALSVERRRDEKPCRRCQLFDHVAGQPRIIDRNRIRVYAVRHTPMHAVAGEVC
jgi:UDP-N-acetylglucosamine 2-epimerase